MLDDTEKETFHIKELDLEIIQPNTQSYTEPKQGGSKLVVIGKPGTGKSSLIKSIIYHKKHIFPVGIFMSGTEDSNNFYSGFVPDCFIYNDYDEGKLEDFIRRQKVAKDHLPNPWSILLLDDCTDDKKMFNALVQQNLFKKGRHYKMLYILSLQHAMDMKPSIRSNVDGVFILRDTNLNNRRTLWENYGGCIPEFSTFCYLMNKLTENYTAIYINNQSITNNWQDCVYFYKAKIPPKDFKFGSLDYWNYHFHRYNKNYKKAY